MAAGSTRPIVIESVFWRAITSAIAANEGTRGWIDSWLPHAAHGGVSGRGVHSAVEALERIFNKGGIIISLDLAKAFDMIDPALAAEILRGLGLDERIVDALLWLWACQKRYVCVGR